ncbi:MAG: Hsp70 family protein, partial [Spirochaetaceae bacterium]
MAERKIGIKIADGTFYPILDEGESTKKRLVLTTASREQENVQIDLYRGSEKDLSDAAYVGSLMVEHVSRDDEGESEIEMIVGVDEDGNLETTAEDKTGGNKQSLSVSLENLDEAALYEVPDFNIEDEDLSGELVEDIDWDTEQEEEAGTEQESEEALKEPSLEEDFDLDLESEDLDLESEEPSLEEDFDLDLEREDLDLGSEDLDLESEEPASVSGISDLEEPFEAEEPDFGEEPFGEDKGFGEDEEQYDSEEAAFGGEESEEQPEEEAPSKGRPLLVAILVILGLALIGALLYLFVFMSQTDEEVPPLEAERAPVEEPAEE